MHKPAPYRASQRASYRYAEPAPTRLNHASLHQLAARLGVQVWGWTDRDGLAPVPAPRTTDDNPSERHHP